MNPDVYQQLIAQECQQHSFGKVSSFQQMMLRLDIQMQKNEVGLPCTKHKN